jgi:hypothetical protein
MRKSYLIIISIVFCILLSCQKETNNRITNITTYELDSVRMEELDVNDSITSALTIPIINEIIDLLNNRYGNHISENGDSINVRKFLPSPYISIDPYYLSELGTILNKKPIIDSNFEYLFAHKNVYNLIKYSYKNNLDSIKLESNSTFAIYTDLGIVQSKYNYIGNTLHSFTEKNTFITNNNFNVAFDTIFNVTNTYVYTYSNSLNNQKDLIGIDLNDLFFNEQIIYQFNISNFSYLNYFAPFLILNSRMSYNTNSNKLIESIQFDRIANTGTFPINISAQYTFDAAKNNRVNTMKITNIINGIQSKILYTFYYKN